MKNIADINNMDSRTDLALEVKESYSGSNVEIEGVEVIEKRYDSYDLKVTKVNIFSKEGASAMGKGEGMYITLEASRLLENDWDYYEEIGEILSKEIKELLPDKEKASALIAGLGNREITVDALGPITISHIMATRHINVLYGENKFDKSVSTIVPGVMYQSGMEAAEVIKGIVGQIKPDIVIVIDALAARSIKRLNTTIQLTNTGINPGSGVGNHRSALDKDSLGVPVIAIGVPTIIDASAYIDNSSNLILTLKDIDENIALFGKMIANSLNEVLI